MMQCCRYSYAASHKGFLAAGCVRAVKGHLYNLLAFVGILFLTFVLCICVPLSRKVSQYILIQLLFFEKQQQPPFSQKELYFPVLSGILLHGFLVSMTLYSFLFFAYIGSGSWPLTLWLLYSVLKAMGKLENDRPSQQECLDTVLYYLNVCWQALRVRFTQHLL